MLLSVTMSFFLIGSSAVFVSHVNCFSCEVVATGGCCRVGTMAGGTLVFESPLAFKPLVESAI